MRVTLGAPGQIMPPASRAIDLARRAEADGFDAVWWPCHLMGWHPDSAWSEDLTPLAAFQSSPHVYFEPLSMMAAAAASTERIRVGVCVTDTIRRHPAMLAQTALTIDHLAGGRAILGLGSGERMNITPYGMEWSRPYSRLAEAIDVMRLLWSTDTPVDFEGRFFRLERAVLGLRPYEGRDPQVWIAAHGPKMLALTGRQGDGWLPTQMPPEEYAEKLAVVRQSAEAAGRDPDAVTPSMLAYVLAAPDEEALARMCAEPLVRLLFPAVSLPDEVYAQLGVSPPFAGGAGYDDYLPTTVTREQALELVDHIPPEIVRRATLHGDARQIADQVRALRQAGLRDVVLWNITAFADPSLAGYSFGVLREVRELLG
ncbi:MAG TPA: LLM class flavin-dependent oxidoreductase [Miltoncostaeaceae bacterium]|jgi:phthiodiolone/phenolphthiodiolone dimycocerosates ketoreductase|nr:LLM class flavin-dependent oxidoreductase [Miltoncostaeaceae bacterium]